GSIFDGEDVVQETFAKAIEASLAAPPDNLKAWLFRIAHNAALDLLRRRAREQARFSNEELPTMPDSAPPIDQRLAAATTLRAFMRLPVPQRSSVILADVLGHSAEEVAAILGSTVSAVKASLHRARARLHELADTPDDAPALKLAPAERARL